MVFSIEKFSSAFCLARGTNEVRDELPTECFVLTDHSDVVRTVIHELRLKFEDSFRPIIHKLAENERITSLYLFGQDNIYFYLKMSENPSYFKFMIICSLVDRLLSTQDCYCIAKVLSVCLITVYYRCYHDLFKEKEKEGQSFGAFSEELHSRYFNSFGIRKLPVSLQLEFTEMLKDIRTEECENFILNNSEHDMLCDALDFVAPEGDLPEFQVTSTTPFEDNSSSIDATLPRNLHLDLSAIQPNLPEDAVTTTMPFENNTSSVGSFNVEEALEDFFSFENIDNSSRARKICCWCQRRCFKYLEAFRLEVIEETTLPLELSLDF